MGVIAIAPKFTQPLNNDIITSHHAMKIKVPIGNNSSAVFRLYLVEQPLGIVNSLFLAFFVSRWHKPSRLLRFKFYVSLDLDFFWAALKPTAQPCVIERLASLVAR